MMSVLPLELMAAEPLEKTWAANVRKVGVDPVAVMKELKDELASFLGRD